MFRRRWPEYCNTLVRLSWLFAGDYHLKHLCLIAAGILGLMSTSPASAILITDEVEVNTFLSSWESVYWEHDFGDQLTATGTISDATLSISFWDDGGQYDGWEFALGVADYGQWAVREIDTGSYSFDIVASSLYDGVLGIYVTSLLGDFGIGTSSLSFNLDSNNAVSASVPEPGVLSLLGAGLLAVGLAGHRRRKRL